MQATTYQPDQPIGRIRHLAQYLSVIFVALSLFMLPFPHGLTKKFIIIGIALSLLSAQAASLKAVLKAPFSLAIFAFIALALFSVTYSSAPTTSHAFTYVAKYTKLLYIPLLILVFQRLRWQQLAIGLFIAGQVVNAIMNISHTHAPLAGITHAPFINIIPISAQLAMAIFFTSLLLTHKPRLPMLIVLSAINLLLIYAMCFIIKERTGVVTLLGCLTYYFYQRLTWRYFLLSLFSLCLAATLIIFLSPTLKTKMHNIGIAMHSTVSKTVDVSQAHSAWLRLQFAKYSWQIIKQHPILGTGAGSFEHEYKKTGGPVATGNALPDPHNAFVMTTVQFGFLGLGFLLTILWTLWRLKPMQSNGPHAYYLRGSIIGFILISCVDVNFVIGPIGVMFCILFAIGAANCWQPKNIPTSK